jgi:general secretion pathway protein G
MGPRVCGFGTGPESGVIDMTTRKLRYQARPGFSLIEITAVILLIGILAAGAAVAILPQVAKARVNNTRNSMQVIKTGIDSYMVENSAPPATLQAMIPAYLQPGSELDSWGNAFYYRVTPDAQRPYDLISAGPDGDFTTTDDNLDVWTPKAPQ